jgi:hypothetical protein
MTQPSTTNTVRESFAHILETCRKLRDEAADQKSSGVSALLEQLSPGQMLKVASASEGLDSAAVLKALCAARLFETEHTARVAPEFNAHLALAA